MYYQEDSLEPTFSLLDEIHESEGGFLPHVALDEVKAVTHAVRFHGEEAVFGYGSVAAVVEGYGSFCSYL